MQLLEQRYLLAGNTNYSFGDELRNYRLAIATTQEYTAAIGGEVAALASVNALVENLNAIFEPELAIHFDLVSGTETIFESSDPTDDGIDNGDLGQMISQGTGVFDAALGSNDAYDVGHVLGATGGGGTAGLASLGTVGSASLKGGGATIVGNISSVGTLGWNQVIAHELGHQFAARHTFNAVEVGSNCNTSTRAPASAYEPASGSTLMSYAGICGANNLQSTEDPVFHSASLEDILDYTSSMSRAAPDSTTPLGNDIPTVDAGLDYAIPAETPFALTAVGTDNDTLTYSWEQLDLGDPQSLPLTDLGNGPLFRAFAPSIDATRVFPKLTDQLSGVDTAAIGEVLPSTTRNMNFRATVRDGNGGVSSDDMLISVVNTAAPFSITTLNTSTSLLGGSNQVITWNVGETDLAPINVSDVAIELSSDGGLTYPYALAASTTNDGTQSITLPNVDIPDARIRVRALGNIFFDINDANFSITSDTSLPGIQFAETGGDTRPAESTVAGYDDQYDVSLNGDPGGSVTIAVSADSQTLVSTDGVNFSASAQLVFNSTAAQTVYVRGVADTVEEGPHTSLLSHSVVASTSSDYPVGTDLGLLIADVIDANLPPVIGIDFDFEGNSPTNWNNYGFLVSASGSDLIRDDGAATTIDFTSSLAGGANSSSAVASVLTIPKHLPSLTGLDGYSSNTSSATYSATWSDLTPGASYGVYVFGLESRSGDFSHDVSIVGGNTVNFTQTLTDGLLAVNDSVGSSSNTLGSYAKQVTADSNGDISLSIAPASGSTGIALAGLALQPATTPPLLPIANLSATTHGDESGPVDVVFTVTLDRPNTTGAPLTFDINDLGTGSATSGSDYTAIAANAQITIPNDATSGSLTVTVSDDGEEESSETLIVEISNPSDSGVLIGIATASAEITDNDASVPLGGPLVGIDFEGVGSNSPTNWNPVSGLTSANGTDLIGEDGSTTTIDLASSYSGSFTGGGSATPTPSTLPQHSQSLAGIDTQASARESEESYTAVFSDLVAGDAYRVYVFGLNNDSVFSYSNDVMITGANTVSFNQSVDNYNLDINGSTGSSSQSLEDFAELIAADINGEIAINVSPGEGADGFALGGLAIQHTGVALATLTLSIDPSSISENGGTATGTVTRPSGTTGNLVVTLDSNDTGEATVPASVTILDGSDSATFTVTGIDDSDVDQTQTVTITASATGFIDASSLIDVTDNEVATQGSLVGIDFDTALNSTPNNWTRAFDAGPWNDLLAEDGSTTPFDLSSSSGFGFVPATISNALPTHTQPLDGLDGQAFTSGTPVTFTWSDLTPGNDYEVYIFGLESFYLATNHNVTITGADGPDLFQQQFGLNELYVNEVTASNAPLSDFARITEADGAGNIVIQITPFNNSDVGLAGLAIREILSTPSINANVSVSTNGDETGPVDIVYTVTLDQTNTSGVPITFDIDDLLTGSATSGVDYNAIASNAQISVPNNSDTGTFTVTVLNDSDTEPAETVDVQISAPSDASVTIGTATASATITDNDQPPTLSVDVVATSVSETDGAAATTVTITRNTDTIDPLDVVLTSSDTSEANIIALATIPANQSSVTVNLDAVNDSAVDGTQAVTITATALGGSVPFGPTGLDFDFGVFGKQTTNLLANYQPPDGVIAALPDGKILAVSESASEDQITIVRHLADGSVDNSFGTAGTILATIGSGPPITGPEFPSPTAIEVAPDGKFIVAGVYASGAETPFLARFNADGSLDSSFGVGGVADLSAVGFVSIEGMDLSNNGKLYIALSSNNAVPHQVMRINPDGRLDFSFGEQGLTSYPDAFIEVSDIAALPDDRFVLLGNYSQGGLLIRGDEFGNLDPTFGNQGNAVLFLGAIQTSFSSLALDQAGRIVIGGTAIDNFERDFVVGRFSADGQLDPSFSDDGSVTFDIQGSNNDYVTSIELQSDGKILAIGYTTPFNNHAAAVARLNEDGSLDSTFDGDGRATTKLGNESDQETLGSTMTSGGALLILGGNRTDVRIAKFNTGVIPFVGSDSIDVTDDDIGVFDYGDAPTAQQSEFGSSYPVTSTDSGARHDISAGGPRLGFAAEAETDGVNSAGAIFDDGNGRDDEDGVVFTSVLFASAASSQTGSVVVELQNADPSANRLDAWIDFNRDGDWNDAGEQIFTNLDLGTTNGGQRLDFQIPQDVGNNVIRGDAYARFRVSTAGSLSPTGTANDGEVEDHLVSVVSSDPFVVDTLNDESDGDYSPGDLSLREAIELSNLKPGPDEIHFDNSLSGGTILLSIAQLEITDDLDIIGLGSENLTVSGNDAVRVLRIPHSGTVNLEGFTITAGRELTNTVKSGGGINATGDLELRDVVVTGNTSHGDLGLGGGIYHSSGTLSLIDSVVSQNSTTGPSNHGGGIYTIQSNIIVQRSLIDGNTTSGDGSAGGGLIAILGDVSIQQSTISNNTTTGLNSVGGGVVVGSGNFTLTDSTVSGNSTTGPGAGIAYDGGNLVATVTNSTISGNTTASSGGGIMAFSGTFNLNNSTVTSNSAPAGQGSGLATNSTGDGSSQTNIFSSIIAGNVNSDADNTASAPSGPNVTSENFNVIGSGNLTAQFTESSDVTGVTDPGLDSLADNGGMTLTHALLAGSPAIDAGDTTTSLAFDQRGSGYPRLSGPRVDVGAFETPAPTAEVESVTYFNEDTGAASGSPVNPTGQRSMIRRIQVIFTSPVTIPIGPISDNSFIVQSTSASPGTQVGLEVLSSQEVSGKQVVILGFTGTELTEPTSQNQPGIAPALVDGNYSLTIGGAALGIDANGDDDGLDEIDAFFRWFGDSDGDRDVDGPDYGRFGLTFLKQSPDPEYNRDMDLDGDGDVDGPDYGRFGLNFLKTLPPPS